MILTHTHMYRYGGKRNRAVVMKSLLKWGGCFESVLIHLFVCRFMIGYGRIVLGRENNVIIIKILLTRVPICKLLTLHRRSTGLCVSLLKTLFVIKITGIPQRKIHSMLLHLQSESCALQLGHASKSVGSSMAALLTAAAQGKRCFLRSLNSQ